MADFALYGQDNNQVVCGRAGLELWVDEGGTVRACFLPDDGAPDASLFDYFVRFKKVDDDAEVSLECTPYA